ncbi:MAG: hypothetical protein ACLUIR_02470 [Faecalibacterium prausnitzii]
MFWYDRYKPLFESVINLTTSLLLVQKFGVAGILGGTVISSVCTCVWVEPYILMRYGIRTSGRRSCGIICAVRPACGHGDGAGGGVLRLGEVLPGKNILWFLLDGILYTLLFAVVMVLFCRKTRPSPSLRAERWLS